MTYLEDSEKCETFLNYNDNQAGLTIPFMIRSYSIRGLEGTSQISFWGWGAYGQPHNADLVFWPQRLSFHNHAFFYSQYMEVRLGHKPRLTWLIYSSIGTQQCSAVGVENACSLGNALFSRGNIPMVIPWGMQARSHVGDVPLLLHKQWCTVVDEEPGNNWVALQPFLGTPTNCTDLVSSSTSFDFSSHVELLGATRTGFFFFTSLYPLHNDEHMVGF